MATYTAVAGGGNWNVAATWTGGTPGGFPVAGDTAILNATSGQVTVTANATCLILNCTGYANTLTINTGFSINVSGTGATISLGGTISTLQQGVLSTISGTTAVTINFNGVTIPRLSCGFNAGASTQTVTINGTNPTVQNLTISNGAAVGSTSLANNALTITSSLNLTAGTTTGLGGVAFNIGGGGIVDITTAARMSNGFTVLAGTTLRMQSTLLISGGTITFNSGSFLTHNNFTLSFATSAATLNSPSINWHNVTYEPGGNSTSLTLLSDLNVSNNFTTSITTVNSIIGSGVTRNINIQGNFSLQSGGAQLIMTNTIVNLLGTGILDAASGYSIFNTTININGTGSYTIGSSTRNFLALNTTNLNLVGTSVATVNTGHLLRILVSSTLSTNNTITGANIGGSQIIWNNLTLTGGATSTLTLAYNTTFIGNLTTGTTNIATINAGVGTGKLLLQGNFSPSTGNSIGGTSTIEFTGSNNQTWNSTIAVQNNITINKSGSAVTLSGTINWGTAGRTLLLTSGSSTLNPGTSTVTIPTNQSVTISNMIFNNLTLNTGVTVTQNITNTINSTLLLSGNATFTGTAGWTAFSFTHGGAGTTCTLKAGVTYTVQGGIFTMIGTAASRAILQSNDVANVTVSIPALSNQMTVSAGSIPNPAAGYVLGSVAYSTALPAALNNILPDRPTIASGSASPYTLVNPIGVTALTAYAGQVGKKAFFNVFGTTNVVYAATRDIDSLGGITIYAGQSFPDSNAASPNQFRTLNWQPLIAPSGSVYYTWVD